MLDTSRLWMEWKALGVDVLGIRPETAELDEAFSEASLDEVSRLEISFVPTVDWPITGEDEDFEASCELEVPPPAPSP